MSRPVTIEITPPPPGSRGRGLPVWAWVLIAGFSVCILLPLGGLILLGILSETGTVPPAEVVSGKQLPDKARRAIDALGVLEPDEEVLYYYSVGLISYEEDGNLLTDRRALSYWRVDDEPYVEFAFYEDILDVRVTTEGSWIEDTVIVVETEETSFELFASAEGGKDENFRKELQRRWRAAGGAPQDGG